MVDFYDLNARHAATLLWSGGTVSVLIVTSAAVRRSIVSILGLLVHLGLSLWLLGLFVMAVATAVVVVAVGKKFGLWEVIPLMMVGTWYVTSGLSLLGRFGDFLRKEEELRKALKVLSPALAASTLMGAAILPFWGEIVLFPSIVLLGVVMALQQSKDTENALYRPVLTVLLAYTVISIVLAVTNLVGDPSQRVALIQSLILPICLTITGVAYMRLLVAVERKRFVFFAKRKHIAVDDYGDQWPLVVEKARLCARDGVVWLEAEGKRYPVNGTAHTVLPSRGIATIDINDIWRVDSRWAAHSASVDEEGESEPFRVNIAPLIRDGLALEEE